MAEAFVEERQLLKSLRWWDGFVIALCNPGFLIASLGFWMGALGTWGAVFVWAISAAVGMLQTLDLRGDRIDVPGQAGWHLAVRAEGWRGRFSLAGPIGAFGYWIGWSVVLSIFGIRHRRPDHSRSGSRRRPGRCSTASVHLGLPDFIAIGCIILVWLLNVFGIRPAVWISYVTGVGLMVPLVIFILVPYLSGNWHSTNMTWALARLRRFQARHGLPVPDGVVGLRRRSLRHLRARVPRHPARYDDRAALSRRVHAAGVPAVPARPWRCDRCAERCDRGAASSTCTAFAKIVGQRRSRIHARAAHRQPVPVDDLLDRRRVTGAIRDRPRRT